MNNRDFKVLKKDLEEAVAQKLNVKADEVKIECDINGDDWRFEVKKGIVTETIKFTEDIIYEALNFNKDENTIDMIYYHEDSFYNADSEDVIGISTKKPSDLKEVA
ncbi:MAG: hypothetical protein RBS91_03085 [Sulfurimonadaceae bacterium]|jgi:thymidylate synthase|nr:hypothetical protein [Sulfurimonadaceae bacterium]